MEYLLIYIISIIASMGIELVGELSIIKELATKGYKLDMEKSSERKTKQERKKDILKKFIPIYNIIHSFKQLAKYEKEKKKILENPSNYESIVEMNKIEKDLFNEKPKAITALNLAISPIDEKNYRKPKGIIKISNGVYRHDNNDGTYTQIKFKKETDIIVITDLEGEILSLEPEQQLKELNKIFNTLYKLDVVIETKSDITKQKEELIEHRDEILAQKDEIKLTLK